MSEQKTPKITIKIEEVPFALGPYLVCEALVEGEPGEPIPTGVVDFRRNSHVMGNATLDDDGRGIVKYTGFSAGKNQIISGYSGDCNYLPIQSEELVYYPSVETLKPVAQKLPPGLSKESPPIKIHRDLRETVFEVNLSAYSIPTPLASNRTHLDNITSTRRINIAGVGSGMKHGDRFTLIGDEAKKVYRGYKEFLTIISGGFNDG